MFHSVLLMNKELCSFVKLYYLKKYITLIFSRVSLFKPTILAGRQAHFKDYYIFVYTIRSIQHFVNPENIISNKNIKKRDRTGLLAGAVPGRVPSPEGRKKGEQCYLRNI